MGEGRSAEWGGFLNVLLPAAVILFLLGYCHLGSIRGSALFRFLLNTTAGNAALGVAVALYAYHVARNLIPPAPKDGSGSDGSVLEILHDALLLLALSAVLYPVLRSVLGVFQGRFDLVAVPLSLAASALALLPLLRERGRLPALGYFVFGAVALATLSLSGEVGAAFAEVSRLVTYIEMLIRELGVA